MFRKGRKRRNGFDAPYSRDQQIYHKYVFLAISIAITTVVLVNWYHASSIDPELQEDETSVSFICGSTAERCNAYCIDCNKTIFQIDHHCSFLNTCIGGKNYLNFITLISFGSLQMALHIIVISLLICTHEHLDFGRHVAWPTILIISLQAVVSCLLYLGVTSLCLFHVYLYGYQRKGTYDWILSERQKKLKLISEPEAENSISESRIEEIIRQQQREQYGQQLEEARLKRKLETIQNNYVQGGLPIADDDELDPHPYLFENFEAGNTPVRLENQSTKEHIYPDQNPNEQYPALNLYNLSSSFTEKLSPINSLQQREPSMRPGNDSNPSSRRKSSLGDVFSALLSKGASIYPSFKSSSSNHGDQEGGVDLPPHHRYAVSSINNSNHNNNNGNTYPIPAIINSSTTTIHREHHDYTPCTAEKSKSVRSDLVIEHRNLLFEAGMQQEP